LNTKTSSFAIVIGSLFLRSLNKNQKSKKRSFERGFHHKRRRQQQHHQQQQQQQRENDVRTPALTRTGWLRTSESEHKRK